MELLKLRPESPLYAPEQTEGRASILADRDRLESSIRIVLAASRRDLDVSQRELAQKMEWTRNHIANYETGRSTLRMADFILIARALRIDPDKLLRRILQW